MAIYEYFCPTCRNTFERRRPMVEAAIATQCEKGHRAERTITAFATLRAGSEEFFAPEPTGGGGCACGGACSCAG
jgi:putative FmdB family regulatory protein